VVSLRPNSGDARHRGRPPGGHGVAVLLKIYAHCIDWQADVANQRISDALGASDTEPEPRARKTAKAKWHLEHRRSKATKTQVGA
jgi:hypothetical protein